MKTLLITFVLVAIGYSQNASSGSSNSIVGVWRDASMQVRFNAGGSGSMFGSPISYTIHGNQLTIIFDDPQKTLIQSFEVRGDTLILSDNQGTNSMHRVHEEAGPGSVRKDMVGLWESYSGDYGQQGGYSTELSLLLSGDGTYEYRGVTSRSTPNGNATSGGHDSGMWTATETTMTLRSRQQGTQVHDLLVTVSKDGARVLILDGQPYFLNHR
jgi:hypothetical protein